MADAHLRLLEFVVTADESDDSLLVTAVNYFRDGGQLAAATPRSVTFTTDAASGTVDTELGEILVFPTTVRLTSTFQA